MAHISWAMPALAELRLSRMKFSILRSSGLHRGGV